MQSQVFYYYLFYAMQLFLMYFCSLWKYFLLTSEWTGYSLFRNCECSWIYLQVNSAAANCSNRSIPLAPIPPPHIYSWLPHEPPGTEAALKGSDDNGVLSVGFLAGMCESERAWPFTFLIPTGFLPSSYKYSSLSVFLKEITLLYFLLSFLPLLDCFHCLCLNICKDIPTIYWPPIMNEMFAIYLILTKTCNEDEKTAVQKVSLLGFKLHICVMPRPVYCFPHHRGTS